MFVRLFLVSSVTKENFSVLNMDHNKQQTRPKHPHNEASRLSKMSFWWTRNLFQIGVKRTIRDSDVYEGLKSHECDRIANKFSALWKQELGRKNPSVLRMFYNAYGRGILLAGFAFSIIETFYYCAQPLFLGALLDNFVDPDTKKEKAYWYASGIVFGSLLPVLTYHPFSYYIVQQGMKMSIGSTRLVYDKVRKCSNLRQT